MPETHKTITYDPLQIRNYIFILSSKCRSPCNRVPGAQSGIGVAKVTYIKKTVVSPWLRSEPYVGSQRRTVHKEMQGQQLEGGTLLRQKSNKFLNGKSRAKKKKKENGK